MAAFARQNPTPIPTRRRVLEGGTDPRAPPERRAAASGETATAERLSSCRSPRPCDFMLPRQLMYVRPPGSHGRWAGIASTLTA